MFHKESKKYDMKCGCPPGCPCFFEVDSKSRQRCAFLLFHFVFVPICDSRTRHFLSADSSVNILYHIFQCMCCEVLMSTYDKHESSSWDGISHDARFWFNCDKTTAAERALSHWFCWHKIMSYQNHHHHHKSQMRVHNLSCTLHLCLFDCSWLIRQLMCQRKHWRHQTTRL